MSFARVIGHAGAAARLARAAADGRVPAAVLLVGPAGIGKRALADAFAARLLCAAPGAGDACGTCAHCTRVGAGTHPDLHLVARDPERRDIRIEQVRGLTRWLALQPLMAARKVGVLDDAHCLSEQAQNALLKTLEEPPGATVLVLVASSAALLLPTVRSRCQVVRLEPLPAAEVVRVLEASGVPAEQASQLAPLAEGSPGRALALAGEGPQAGRDDHRAERGAALGLHQHAIVAQEEERTRIEVVDPAARPEADPDREGSGLYRVLFHGDAPALAPRSIARSERSMVSTASMRLAFFSRAMIVS